MHTLYDKLWSDHLIEEEAVATTVLGAASAGTNCPEKQAWRMINLFLAPDRSSMASS